jgi:uncharacterized protein
LSEEIDHLWALSELDEQAHGIHAGLARFPAQRKELEQRVTEAKARVEQAKARLAELQKQRKAIEVEAGSLADQERKFLGQLPAVKKNEEYTALLHEIEATRQKCSALETQILERMDEEERTARERPELDRALKAAEQEAVDRAKVLDAEQAREQAALDTLEARREAHVKVLPPATRARYERVHASRDGRAVVPILKGACGGCFRGQPPALLQEARRRERVLSCDGCGRLILWPPGDAV